MYFPRATSSGVAASARVTSAIRTNPRPGARMPPILCITDSRMRTRAALTGVRHSMFPPGRGGEGGGQAGLHDQGVLAGVVVVAAPAPDHAEAEGLVERSRL